MAAKKTAKKTKKAPARSKAPGKAKARAGAGTLKMSTVMPGLTVKDVGKSLAWYRDVLGFAVQQRWEHEGKLMGVSLQAGSVGFMIGQDDWKKGRNRKKGVGFRLYCTTAQDVDALARRIVARGGKLDQVPRDQPWGMRDFALTDPDGFKITIGAQKR